MQQVRFCRSLHAPARESDPPGTGAAAHAALMFAGKIPSQEAYSIAADGSVSKTNVEASKLNNVLVVAYGAGGSYTAIVLSK